MRHHRSPLLISLLLPILFALGCQGTPAPAPPSGPTAAAPAPSAAPAIEPTRPSSAGAGAPAGAASPRAAATLIPPQPTPARSPIALAPTATPGRIAPATATPGRVETGTGVASTQAGRSPTAPERVRTARAVAVPATDLSGVRLRAERVAAGFVEPLFVTHAGDGSGRLFVLERRGRVRLLDGTVILDITDRVKAARLNSYDREQGLLGLAFHPRFAENGFFYLHYNDPSGNHVFSRFRLGPDGLGDRSSETVLLTEVQPETNFNGGMITFGPDGYLYIGLGTGGATESLQWNAQDLGSLLGKMLRIDVDWAEPYAIPWDNPFVGTPGARPEIWAYGLRNPWRFSFDRATHDLYIGGPGQFQREWVNFQPAGSRGGENYGWPILEGTLCWQARSCDTAGLERPIIEYNTYDGGNCVIIGGYAYRGPSIPDLQGAYLYGDFCSGRVWAATPDAAGAWKSTEMLKINNLLSSFGEDEDGELYVTDIGGGLIYRLAAGAR